jgi:hypothetical protein
MLRALRTDPPTCADLIIGRGSALTWSRQSPGWRLRQPAHRVTSPPPPTTRNSQNDGDRGSKASPDPAGGSCPGGRPGGTALSTVRVGTGVAVCCDGMTTTTRVGVGVRVTVRVPVGVGVLSSSSRGV